ncbi:MAG: hypothetical protein LLG04_14115 [Parachlamydia sp.]|nr:hypothetical protein [Parachlamydia sp.]
MSALAGSLITVIQFGWHWFGMRITAEDKTMITNALQNKDVARIAAQRFAQENRLPYQDDAVKSHKPVVTIRNYLGSWMPAKIFPERIEDAGVTTEDKNEAIEWAREIAANENLDFAPSIGASVFKEET